MTHVIKFSYPDGSSELVDVDEDPELDAPLRSVAQPTEPPSAEDQGFSGYRIRIPPPGKSIREYLPDWRARGLSPEAGLQELHGLPAKEKLNLWLQLTAMEAILG